MSKPEVETRLGIKCVAIDTDDVGGNGDACDKCCFSEHCNNADTVFDFPCYIAEEEREYPCDICYRLATPVEIFESEKEQ